MDKNQEKMNFGIRAKLLLFAAGVWAVIFGVYSVYIYNERIEQTRRMALSTASFLTSQIAADRQFYTSTVVKRAMEAGLEVSANYHDIEGSIPLPATFVREVSESLATKGSYRMRLVSSNPVNPKSLPQDDFHKDALDSFKEGAGTRHYSFETFGGKKSVRYMVPDLATSQTCVDCHNRFVAQTGKTYKIGDVIGALEVIIPIESELAVAMTDVWRSIAYGFVVVLGMGLLGLAFIRRVVTTPLSRLGETTGRIAVGDLTYGADVDTGDEIGELSREVSGVVENLHHMIEDIRRVSDEAADISGHLRGVSKAVVDGSNRQDTSLDSISSSVEDINSSIAEISRGTELLADSMEKGSSSVLELGASINEVVDSMENLFISVDETAHSTKDMSFSIKETSENIENLSSSVTQVSSSMVQINSKIKEVETNAAEASRFAEDVIRDAKEGLETVESTRHGMERIKELTVGSSEIIDNLCERIKEVGKILDVIRDVAEETNLLALNAAIIAAQSGEEGKSFAVVANEIRDLAERTSTSAKEVSEIIQAVDTESARAGKAMERGVESVEKGVRLSALATEGLEKIVSSAQKSTSSVREIARASAEQSKESRMVAESTEKLAEMARRIVNATQAQARGSELINRASERMSEIAYKIKGTTWSQAEANKSLTQTIEDVNRMVLHINSVLREQSRNTAKVLESIEAVRMVSVDNLEKAVSADEAVEKLAILNRELTQSVKKFKLKR